jgi:succinate dehydrogenase / fumarate reductase, cytochrome b subunit
MTMAKLTSKIGDKNSDLAPRNMKLGMYAWLVQRLSGLYLVAFLLAHIAAIAQAGFGITTGFQAQIFDLLRNPFYLGGSPALAFDFIALGTIAFHGMNGIRIVFLDLGIGVRRHRLGFLVTMIVAVAATAVVIFLGLPLLTST